MLSATAHYPTFILLLESTQLQQVSPSARDAGLERRRDDVVGLRVLSDGAQTYEWFSCVLFTKCSRRVEYNARARLSPRLNLLQLVLGGSDQGVFIVQ